MNTIAERIRHIRGERTQEEFAAMVGVKQKDISGYERGREPRYDILMRIAEIDGYSLHWVITGLGPQMDLDRKQLGKKAQEALRDMQAAVGLLIKRTAEEYGMDPPELGIQVSEAPADALDRPKIVVDEEFAEVPLLADPAAAGSPREIDTENVEGYCVIYRKWLTHPKETTCIRIKGDSMEPVLQDGSIVAVNHAVRTIEEVRNRIVAAHVSDEGVVVKWLRQTQSGRWILESENREYPILDLEAEDRIIGKIEWAWSLFR